MCLNGASMILLELLVGVFVEEVGLSMKTVAKSQFVDIHNLPVKNLDSDSVYLQITKQIKQIIKQINQKN